MDNNKKESDRKKGMATFFIVLSLIAIITIITVTAIDKDTMKNKNKNNTINKEEKRTEEKENNTRDLNDIILDIKENTNDETEKIEDTTKQNTKNKSEEDSEVSQVSADSLLNKIKYPVASQKITMAYSLNKAPVFSKTFNEYRSDHNGVDFKAKIGEDVKAVLDGTVVEIRNDEKLGKTIKIDHGDNLFTEYSNLKEAKVKLNDKVKAGKVIATVGKSASYEIGDEEHLHFSLIVKNEYVDASKYF